MELSCVFESSDFAEVQIVKDLFENNKIDVLIKNMYNQNILGGLIPIAGVDPIAGAIQIFVQEKDVDKCLGLLDKNQNKIIATKNPVFEENEELNDDKLDKNYIEEITIKKNTVLIIVFTIISFIFIPYILNMVLIKNMYKHKKMFSISMFIISSVIFVGPLLLVFFYR